MLVFPNLDNIFKGLSQGSHKDILIQSLRMVISSAGMQGKF